MKLSSLRLAALGATTLLTGMLVTTSCKKSDDSVGALTLSSATAGGTDIDNATSIDPSKHIVLHFSRAVDGSSVTASSVMLTADGSAANLAGTPTTAGDSVVIAPASGLAMGAHYTLTLGNTIRATDGGAYAGDEFTFATSGPAAITAPQEANMVAYLSFNSTMADAKNALTMSGNVATTMVADRKGNANSAVSFDGNTSIAEYTGASALLTGSWTRSFWVYVDTANHSFISNDTVKDGNGVPTGVINHNRNKKGNFVMGVADLNGFFYEIQPPSATSGMKETSNFKNAAGENKVADLYFDGTGTTQNEIQYRNNLNASGGLQSVFTGKWAHVVVSYDATSRIWQLYINGTVQQTNNMAQNTNLAGFPTGGFNPMPDPANGAANQILALGFFHDRGTTHWANEPWGGYTKLAPDGVTTTGNHFKGSLDEIRFWNVALSAADVTDLYNKEK